MTARVTKAHRAAVCALVLAGQSFDAGCRVAGVSPSQLRGFMLRDWWSDQPRDLAKRWTGQPLMRLKIAYCDPHASMDALCERFHTSRGAIIRLANLHGWPKRGQGRRPAHYFTSVLDQVAEW